MDNSGTHLLAILLAEHDNDDASVIKKYAKNFAEVTWAETLNMAIEYLSKSNFDAILLDLNLSKDANNLDCVTEIKKITSIPLIILTSCDNTDLAEQAMLNGADDYLIKQNITSKVLFRRIRMVMCRRKYLLSKCSNGLASCMYAVYNMDECVRQKIDNVIKKMEVLNGVMGGLNGKDF